MNPTNRNLLDTYVRLVVISLIAYWSFLIFKPFLVIVIWAMIIAVAFYPLFANLTKRFKGRSALTATLISLILIIIIIVPSVQLTSSVVSTAKDLKTGLDEGTLEVSSPKEGVKDWPVVGNSIYKVWNDASVNLDRTLKEHQEEVSKAVSWLYNSIAGLFSDVLSSIAAIAIAGVLLHFAGPIYHSVIRFFKQLSGTKAKEYTDLCRDTIRSVVKGLVLIALIQGVLSGIGFALADIPGAGIWAILVILLAIIQLPVILLMIPMIIYVFSHAEQTWVAIVFAVYAVVVGSLDNFLKPVLLGRGLKVPMPVILIGAIGGMILHGLIGLFIGPVVLAIGWQVYNAWLEEGEKNETTQTETSNT